MRELSFAKAQRGVRRLRSSIAWGRQRRQRLRRLETPAQLELIDRLRDETEALRVPQTGETSPTWSRNRGWLISMIASRDPRAFLAWQFIRSSMFMSSWRSPAIDLELGTLRQSPRWDGVWKELLVEDDPGCPAPYWQARNSSANLIHHCYHCHEFERITGRSITSFANIFEFGAGYGSLARIAVKLGLAGQYQMFDFPEFAALQRYYIASVSESRGEPRFKAQIKTVQAPFFTDSKEQDDALFVALWSLSEAPLSERVVWAGDLCKFSGLLFAYQTQFENIDNHTWFRELAERLDMFHWEFWPISHMKRQYYVAAVRVDDHAPHARTGAVEANFSGRSR